MKLSMKWWGASIISLVALMMLDVSNIVFFTSLGAWFGGITWGLLVGREQANDNQSYRNIKK